MRPSAPADSRRAVSVGRAMAGSIGALLVGVSIGGLAFGAARPWLCAAGCALGAALNLIVLFTKRKPTSERSDPSLVVLPERRSVANPDRPRIVAIGGGHGLSSVLRGLVLHDCDVTAIVTVADDGGSSGVLRREIGMPPPGDLRRCIAALAEAEPLMARLLEYRFGQGSALDGHAFGNLFIAAMMGITGDFESAVIQASRVLAVQGRIIPSSLDDVVLCAEVRHSRSSDSRAHLVRGQSKIAESGGIVQRVFVEPENARGYPEAVQALLQANLVLLGPGSLYTSILPNLLIRDIRDSLAASSALKVYVCNVATQPGETDGFNVGDHVQALNRYVGEGFCDCVLANSNMRHAIPTEIPSELVKPVTRSEGHCEIIREDLVDTRLPWRHDPIKLASALFRLYHKHRFASVQERLACG